MLLLVGGVFVWVQAANPPEITDLNFPSQIKANGQFNNGLVSFKDDDGDVNKADFTVVQGNASNLRMDPGFSFNTNTAGQTSGFIQFKIAAQAAGSYQVQVVLSDAAGNHSQPKQFAFSATGTPTPPPQPSPPQPSPPPPTTPGPCTVGAILTLTGDLHDLGSPVRIAVELAIDQVNAAGGPLDQPLRLEVRDDETNSQKAGQVAQDLVALGVPAIIGPLYTGAVLAAAPVTIPPGVLLISPTSTSSAVRSIADQGFIFRTMPPEELEGVVLAKLAVDRRYRTISILARDDTYGHGLATQLSSNFERLGGLVLATVFYNIQTTDYSQQIALASAGTPDAISVIGFNEIGEVIRQMLLRGITNFDLTSDVFDIKSLVSQFGSSVFEGKVFGGVPVSPGVGRSDAFIQLYRQKVGSVADEFGIREAYDAAMVVALAIQASGQCKGTAIRDAMRLVADPPGTIVSVLDFKRAKDLLRAGQKIDYDGASGPVDFDERGDVLDAIVLTFEIQGGQVKLLQLCRVHGLDVSMVLCSAS
jgi:ABC-type branched-subunit amino acid transport system substrate-binding protein